MFSFRADFRLSILLMVRSRLWRVAATLCALVAFIAVLAAEFSPRQPATVALDVGLSFIRLAVPFVALLNIQDLLSREIERRLILTSLTFPRSRSSFLLARYGAVVVTSIVMTILLCVVLAAVVSFVGKDYDQSTKVDLGLPYVLTIFYLLLDVAVVAAFGVALATISTTPNLVFLGGIGFMVAARSASTIIHLLQREENIVKGGEWYRVGLESVMWAIPDLGALDIRPITLYGKWELLPSHPFALVLMALAYSALLLLLGCIRFERRQFA
ncbi:MAG TPA: hypothetical protein VFW68_05445 [Rhodocyclaceae bacterium]|nr:hypothetical protein [Rhodocyclaceae bacterium]